MTLQEQIRNRKELREAVEEELYLRHVNDLRDAILQNTDVDLRDNIVFRRIVNSFLDSLRRSCRSAAKEIVAQVPNEQLTDTLEVQRVALEVTKARYAVGEVADDVLPAI